MRIEVVGGGSLGLLLAARLAPHCRLQLRVRTESQAAGINRQGVALTAGADGREKRTRLPVFATAGNEERDTALPFEPDWLLLTLKQKDITSRFVRELAGRMLPDTRLLCFQNGLGHAEKLAEAVPAERIWLAVTTEGAKREAPDAVRHTGAGISRIGKASTAWAADDDAAFARLSPVLDRAGLRHERRRDIRPAVWEKLIVNAVINPLTAVMRVTNGELLENKARLGLMKDLFEEARSAALAHGVPLADTLWDDVVQVCKATAANRSSMLQDVESGRETEMAWISGAILEKAKEKSLKLPATELLCRIVSGIEPSPGDCDYGDASSV